LKDVIAVAVAQHSVARHYPAGMLLEHDCDGHGRPRDQLLLGSNELHPDVDPLCCRVDRTRGAPYDSAQPAIRAEDRHDLRSHAGLHVRGVFRLETDGDLHAIGTSQLQHCRIRLYPIAERHGQGCNVPVKRRSYHFGRPVIAELSLRLDGCHRVLDRLLGSGELRIGREVLGKESLGAVEVTLGEIERGNGRLVTHRGRGISRELEQNSAYLDHLAGTHSEPRI